MSIANNLCSIQAKLRELEKLYHKKDHSITLLAVSKGQSVDAIVEAALAGQKHFAENYVQEALNKINVIKKEALQVDWHFIGRIQSNKIQSIAQNFSWVQSVTHLKQAELLNKFRSEDALPLQICLQINVSDDQKKSGMAPEIEGILRLAQQIQRLPKLRLRGLMAIPDQTDQDAFKKMAEIFCQLNEKDLSLNTLSMGMSQDYEAAIEHGANMVRIGTAIFGAREESV